MQSRDLLLHVYGEMRDGQWTLLCLEFCLAAQADSYEEARKLLNEQIVHYLEDATSGVDQEHAGALLLRRAPLKFWVKFYWEAFLTRLDRRHQDHHRAQLTAIPLVPAGA